jgi:toxin ParE1/3/4
MGRGEESTFVAVMGYRLIVRPLAEQDLKEAINWYNLQVEGLGNKFINYVDRKLTEIVLNPLQYQVRYKNLRMTLLEKFPYNIHFTVSDNIIIVHSFYHTGRNPKRAIKRLK